MSAKKKHNAAWTPRDLARMRRLAAQRKSSREAAQVLGRSTGAVKFKAMIEGVRFRAINQPAGVQKRRFRKIRRAA